MASYILFIVQNNVYIDLSIAENHIDLMIFGVLAPLSAIFKLYHGDQF